MHELGLMEAAIDAAVERTRREGGAAIRRMVLRVGELAGADPQALSFAFAAASPGTPAAGAELRIESVPARAFCPSCRREFAPEPGGICACPLCGRLSSELRAGREIELASIEIDLK